jgi:AraC family transcriptional regulator
VQGVPYQMRGGRAKPLEGYPSRPDEWGNLHVSPVFASSLLCLCRWECGAEHKDVADEHFPRSPQLIMPHAVPFVLWHRGRQKVIDPNSFVFFNGGEAYRALHRFGCGDHGTGLILSPDAMRALAEEFDRSLEDRPQPFTDVRAPSSPAAYVAERLILQLALRAAPGDALTLEELALELTRHAMAALYREAPQPPPAVPGSAAQDLCDGVKELLARRMGLPLSLAAIASDLGVSVSYLERTFRRVTGTPIHQYRKRLRLREALRRVVDGQRDLAGIALDLGFCSHSHLTAAFRREFGVSPRALRGMTNARAVRSLLRDAPSNGRSPGAVAP